MSIPVICDRCRAAGTAGTAEFAHLGDLLDFTPVPRKTQRADGWTPDRQRAFVAALSATGSRRQAAQSIGMAPFGADQLLKAEGSDSFRAAVERAHAIAARHGSMKLAQGVADAQARASQLAPAPSRLRGLPAPPEPDDDEDEGEEHKLELLSGIAGKFLRKVAAERAARLGGEIVAADFYLRQVTVLEVLFDLGASDAGWDPMVLLRDLRRCGQPLLKIASTPFSDALDAQRRAWWAAEGDPERPAHPDARFLRHRSGRDGECATTIDDHTYGGASTPSIGYTQEEWSAMTISEQEAARKRQHMQDAAEQRSWEAAAHRDYEERRGSGASS